MVEKRHVQKPQVFVTLKNSSSAMSFLKEISRDDRIESYSLRPFWDYTEIDYSDEKGE